MRVFIALNLSKETIKEIGKIQKTLEKEGLFLGKLTELKNLHLTLKFLGEIDESKLKEVEKRLEEIKFPDFNCSLGALGVFSENFIKIIWIELTGAEELQKIIDESLKGIFETESRFMRHVTLARVKKVVNKELLIEKLKKIKVKETEFNVKAFYLMKSELSEKGPIFDVIKEYSLESI